MLDVVEGRTGLAPTASDKAESVPLPGATERLGDTTAADLEAGEGSNMGGCAAIAKLTTAGTGDAAGIAVTSEVTNFT